VKNPKNAEAASESVGQKVKDSGEEKNLQEKSDDRWGGG